MENILSPYLNPYSEIHFKSHFKSIYQTKIQMANFGGLFITAISTGNKQ